MILFSKVYYIFQLKLNHKQDENQNILAINNFIDTLIFL